jgi:hypothetical protein
LISRRKSIQPGENLSKLIKKQRLVWISADESGRELPSLDELGFVLPLLYEFIDECVFVWIEVGRQDRESEALSDCEFFSILRISFESQRLFASGSTQKIPMREL